MATLQIPADAPGERHRRAAGAGDRHRARRLRAIASPALSDGFPWLIAALLLGGLGAAHAAPDRLGAGRARLCGRRARSPRSAPTISPATSARCCCRRRGRAAAGADAVAAGASRCSASSGLSPRSRSWRSRRASRRAQRRAAEREDGRCGRRLGRPRRVSSAALDRRDRRQHARGFPDVPAVPLIGKGASVADRGLRADAGVRRRRAGKLVCAWIGARFGIIGDDCVTEGFTGAGMLAMLPLPLALGAGAAAVRRRRAQRHLVGRLRLGAADGVAGERARARSACSTPARSAQARSRRFSTG